MCRALWNEVERKDEFKLRTEILNTNGNTMRLRLGIFKLSSSLTSSGMSSVCCMYLHIKVHAYYYHVQCIWASECEWMTNNQITVKFIYLFLFRFGLRVFPHFFFCFALLLSDESRTFSLAFLRSASGTTKKCFEIRCDQCCWNGTHWFIQSLDLIRRIKTLIRSFRSRPFLF